MRITCPYCGERGLDEFAYHGDATVVRPDAAAENATEAFYTYGYERKNGAGVHDELWYHGTACRAWLVVTRDTRTHEIFDVKPAREVALARTAASMAEPR